MIMKEVKITACNEKATCAKKSCEIKAKPCGCGAAKKSASKKKATLLVKVDIGWGNSLFIRGEGGKLSWDKGIALSYDEKKQGWVFETTSTKKIEFKVLINDDRWSDGDNFVLNPGEKLEIEPIFS